MATAAGASVANLYYAQPILTLIARSFNVPGGVAAQVAAATQVGYAAGLVLLVPLGDAIDRRRLILWQAAGLVAALAMATAAPTLPALIAASLGIGAAASIAQQLIPIAAEMAAPEARGRTVGTVMRRPPGRHPASPASSAARWPAWLAGGRRSGWAW